MVEFLCAFEGHPWDNSSRGIVEPKRGLEILVAVAKEPTRKFAYLTSPAPLSLLPHE